MILILSKTEFNMSPNKSELLHGRLKKILVARIEMNGNH